jgi:hypothetical protein
MARVDWPAIEADVWKKPALLQDFLGAVVAPFAKALEWTEPEFVYIAGVWRYVVANDCRLNHTARAAIETQRFAE